MNYIVYILQDDRGEFYKGLTSNLPRRLSEHRKGDTWTTSRMHNLELVYQENCANFREARERELYFKSAAGRRFLKKILEKRL